MSEEPIHDRCAGLDDGPDLMPVDQFGDGGAAVADELRDVPEGHAGIGEQRNEGVQSAGSSPGTRARARRRSRRTLAAFMPVPSRVVNTSPVSVHRSPAASWSFACCTRWTRSASTQRLAKARVRRDFRVLVSP